MSPTPLLDLAPPVHLLAEARCAHGGPPGCAAGTGRIGAPHLFAQ